MSGAQPAILLSITCIAVSRAIASMITARTIANTRSDCMRPENSNSKRPSPLATSRSSTITIPVMERPRPILMPAKIAGIALGRTIRRQICPSLAPKDLAISISEGSTLRTPARVLTVMNTKANRTTINTRAESQSKGNNDYWDERRNRHG